MKKDKKPFKVMVCVAGSEHWFTLQFKTEDEHHLFCEQVYKGRTEMVDVDENGFKFCLRPSAVATLRLV
jgi:hypothetical protein